MEDILSAHLINPIVTFYLEYPRTFISVIFFLVYALYYFREVAQKPRFYCKDGKFRWFVLANVPMLYERYWPTFWCFGTHAQTVFSNALRSLVPMPVYKREYIKMSDGGIVSLDWFDPLANQKAVEQQKAILHQVLPPEDSFITISKSSSQPRDKFPLPSTSALNQPMSDEPEDKPIAIFFPGLTGDSSTEYIKTLLPGACALGYRVCVFNNRGRGGMPLKTPRMYCAANCDDFRETLEHLRRTRPKARIVATGISLGGIVLSRYLIQMGK